MSEWKEYKLGEIIQFGNGKERPKTEGNIPVFGGNGILGYCDKHNYENETVIIGRVGAYCGSVFYQNKMIWISDNALAAKPKNNYNTKFIYYFLNNLKLNSFAQGSSHPLVTQTLLNSIDVVITKNIEEQRAIAAVLSSLDDKIDLLHRQNKTLEQLAETMFYENFIVGNEKWEEKKLGEYVCCINGVSYKSEDLKPSKTAMVTLKSFDRNGGFRHDGFKEYTGKYKTTQVVDLKDLVVAHTDITQDAEVIGNPILVVPNSMYDVLIISMDLVKVVSKFDWLPNVFLYLLMKTREFKEHCVGCSNGSTVLHLNKEAIPSFQFKVPPEKLIYTSIDKLTTLIDKQFNNFEQIRTLTGLRDTLLPKLMSGEVRVMI